jgi:acyl-CoA reductase-like NAD-dependent aldehyde dehydrogenase
MTDIVSFIGGTETVLGTGGFDLIRPQDGGVIGRIVEAGTAGVDAAVASAQQTFLAHRKSTLHQRIGWLQAGARAIEAAADQLVEIIVEDVGKPIRSAKFEVKRGAEFMMACAATASQLGGELVPLDAAATGAGCIGMVRHIPYGVVAAVTPFNAPINLLVQKVAPAVAAGNSVVAKPAPAGMRTALLLARLLVEAGWPAGLFNVLTGDKETALALAAHPQVRAVSFTGGTAAGDALARAAGAK